MSASVVVKRAEIFTLIILKDFRFYLTMQNKCSHYLLHILQQIVLRICGIFPTASPCVNHAIEMSTKKENKKMNERELVVNVKQARERLDSIKSALKDAQAVYDKVEMQAVEYLTGIEADATAKYDNVGYLKMSRPRIFASCKVENKEALKIFLKEKGREDLIKEDVSAQSLSGYVGELVEQGKPIPEIISYYLKTSVRIY